ncbi:MAG: HAD family hydrolase [SAR202 cluster bacterium]|jgi:HAD superfamily hydrolase (TIGR01509 family)|nr:HAD family hydrolase [SAR202 cluster bacterium]
MSNLLDLVIFDCDGVLVDSEPISNRVLADLLTEIGLPTTLEQSLGLFLGKSWKDNFLIIQERLGRTPPQELYEIYTNRMYQAFEAELKPIPGIESALDQISLKTCVASSGPHMKIRKTLGVTGLLPRFENHIFSADDVENGKPAPDLFLYACEKMGSKSSSSVVVEDALPGVQSAVSAGMTVLAYTPSGDVNDLKKHGVATFEDILQLPNILNGIMEGTFEL